LAKPLSAIIILVIPKLAIFMLVRLKLVIVGYT
jgi:hypothetical protein